MRRAVSRNAAPAGVNATLRLVRASKGAPTCASSRWIAWLNGGCAMQALSRAVEMQLFRHRDELPQQARFDHAWLPLM